MLPKILPVDSQADQPPRSTRKLIGPLVGPAASGRETFAEALLEHSSTRPGRRTFQFLSASFIQILVLTMAVLLPLMYTETIDMQRFTTTLLVAPPPPPPPPPPAAPIVEARPTRAPKRVFSVAGKLQAPTTVPRKIAMLKEEPLPSEFPAGVAGGVPGGVPGGQLGGVLGGIIGGVASGSQHLVEPPPPAAAKAPVRVGGNLSPPRQIHFQEPYYPPLARQARIQGDVQIDAVIDTDGHVVEMKAISGHPLFIEAALKAVSQWRYQPTLLNSEPVLVQFVVTVHFRLTS